MMKLRRTEGDEEEPVLNGVECDLVQFVVVGFFVDGSGLSEVFFGPYKV